MGAERSASELHSTQRHYAYTCFWNGCDSSLPKIKVFPNTEIPYRGVRGSDIDVPYTHIVGTTCLLSLSLGEEGLRQGLTVTLAVLELTMQMKLILNIQRLVCFYSWVLGLKLWVVFVEGREQLLGNWYSPSHFTCLPGSNRLTELATMFTHWTPSPASKIHFF